MAGHFWNKL